MYKTADLSVKLICMI